MKKILVVIPELETGGGQRLALSIVRHISSLEMQIKILVLYPKRGDILEQLAKEWNLDVEHLNKKNGIDFNCILDIYHYLIEFKPDVIHAHLRVIPYLLLPMVFSKIPLRYYTVHNLAEKDATGFKQRILNFAFKYCNVHPVAISPLCQKSITDLYGIPKEKIPCINVGIDINEFSPKTPYKRISDEFNFVAVGRLSDQKDYPLMLKAFEKINSKYPNTKLTIIGDGELKKSLEEQSKSLGISNSVLFTGIISNVKDYLWSSDVYIMSSIYEGLPQTVIEAMAAGLPIISTKAGGVIDVVKDGENGFLVDCNDLDGLTNSMENLIQSPSLCEEFSANSIKLSKEYSIQNCAEQYKELYLK